MGHLRTGALPRSMTWPESISTIGKRSILQNKKLALFCSVKCPGNLILQTYDFVKNIQNNGMVFIGGFHSPIERECLAVLLRSAHPIIICPARSIEGMRIRTEYKKPLKEGRLLFLSPFIEKPRRATVKSSMSRNCFVAAMADSIFISYAEPGSKTEQFCQYILAWDKAVYTLKDHANDNIISMGVIPISSNDSLTEFVLK
jgi:predicted Rossmann fold nucleotide-binding protein DprA/Smf involved in DNA uptake